MQKPLEMTFRNTDPWPALEEAVRERAGRLEQFCGEIIGCSVVVESPHKHHHKGNLFHVRIDLTVPDTEIVVQRSPDEEHAHEDPYVADDARAPCRTAPGSVASSYRQQRSSLLTRI